MCVDFGTGAKNLVKSFYHFHWDMPITLYKQPEQVYSPVSKGQKKGLQGKMRVIIFVHKTAFVHPFPFGMSLNVTVVLEQEFGYKRTVLLYGMKNRALTIYIHL